MAIEVKKRYEVWTADEQQLGTAHRLFHRTHEISPELQLFATYLVVKDFAYGETFYIPTDFFDELQTGARRLVLSKTRDEAMKLTWFRMPDFVARGQSRTEELSD